MEAMSAVDWPELATCSTTDSTMRSRKALTTQDQEIGAKEASAEAEVPTFSKPTPKSQRTKFTPRAQEPDTSLETRSAEV